MKIKNKKVYKASATWQNLMLIVIVPLLFLFTCEWIHRGTLNAEFFQNRLLQHIPSYFIAWLFLQLIYLIVLFVSWNHTLATILTGIISNVPAVITWFKLTMRGEPFLPWDISQLEDFLSVSSKVRLNIQASMIITLIIFIAISALAWFVHMPKIKDKRLVPTLVLSAISAALFLWLFFGIFLSSASTLKLRIYPDMWMQDRYYKNHGVITGFLTNLQALKIEKPQNYNEQTIQQLKNEIENTAKNRSPIFKVNATNTVTSPNIVYVMNESFWDVQRLNGIEFDSDLTPNLKKMQNEGASGFCYTPSFGGGTCDVEFEALTGFSVENLPSGSKPYQQHVTKDMFSYVQFLKSKLNYDAKAIHTYYRKFWSRISAYPNLGFNEFISSENFVLPEMQRGYISDMEMSRRIISELENKNEQPLFIHAVTMQNHTTYDKNRYSKDELVNIIQAPENLSQKTLDELQDFATGIKQADAALGELMEYLSESDEPTILVFWGDHFNPVGKDYELYEKTGFINYGQAAQSPRLHETDIAVWSNFKQEKQELGTIASYNISAIVTELYKLERPLLFEYLLQQLSFIKARTRGITVNTDNSTSQELTEEQTVYTNKHSLLQYDLMFGDVFLDDYVPKE